jgi:ubiquinone/menaquinone biosynthesis C-methylase UbiE
MDHQTIGRLFDQWAGDGRDIGMESGHGDVVEQVIASMRFRPGERVLELGCGNGWATRKLAKAAPGATAVGVDVSPAMIARAEALHSYTIRARYELSPFEQLDFPDGHFDRVFSMEALYYAIDLDRALAEALRVLKPGGVADFIVDFYKESAATECWQRICGMPMHYRSEAQWKALLEKAGFAQVELRRVVDRRGPGEEKNFQPSECYPDWETRRKTHEAGSLWMHAQKP